MDDRICLRSITFNMISTLVRGSMPQKVNADSKSHQSGSYIYFKEKEIQISEKEKELLKRLNANELLLRMVTGQIDQWLKSMLVKSHSQQKFNKNKAHVCDSA
jgi:hypothetical protein